MALWIALGLVLSGGDVRADDAPAATPGKAAHQALLLRTVVVHDELDPRGKTRDPAALSRAQQLDLVLADAVQDLGFTLDLSEASTDRELSDLEVLARAAKTDNWVIYPSIDARGSDTVVRFVAVAPGSKVASVRTEAVKPSELAVRAVVMLRDVVAARSFTTATELAPRRADRPQPPTNFAVPARSQGRSTLAFNGALFGGFVGYSVQRGTGSDDPRLLFPLVALGTGLGLGASVIVAEEWDVGLGDAWFLSGAAWWPALSGLLVARGRVEPDPPTEYSYAVIGALSGLGLGTTALALGGGMSEGGALLTHSGGAFGTVLGGMTEYAIRGTTDGDLPFRGLGYGAGIGVVLAGAMASQFDVDSGAVLAVDLGAGLGGLAGAAVTSPFIFRKRTETGDRAFVMTTMGATLAGGITAWLWTRKSPPPRSSGHFMAPYAGVIGESQRVLGGSVPVLGFGVSGVLP